MKQQWADRLIEELKQKGDAFCATASSPDHIMKWTKLAALMMMNIQNKTIIKQFLKIN